MRSVRNVVASKSIAGIVSIGPDATVQQAAEAMVHRRIGALLVVDDGEPVGLLTERDVMSKVVATGLSADELLVEEVMGSHLRSVPAHFSTDAAMVLMTQSRQRHLLVEEDGRLLGLVSIGDLVKEVIDDQKFVIEQLEAYIGMGVSP